MSKPFLKWAGGKSKLVSVLKEKFPQGNRFIEPFIGAGAVSLNVDYNNHIINDINKDLIYVWQYLQSMKMDFVEECAKLFISDNNTKESFISLRQEFNDTIDPLRRAILFVYLNKHGFNGMCRYNSKGKYNIPFGKYNKPHFSRKEFVECIGKINKFKIYNKDFREIFDMIVYGDVVYCDPPYIPLSKTSNFNTYAAGGFSLKDQSDLAECAYTASKKGAIIVVSNSCTDLSLQIYNKAQIFQVDAMRTISANGSKRGNVKEIIAVFKGK
jgi:DNA adenine methylase